MPGKGTIDAVFISRRLQEEYLDKEKKLYMCFVDLEKAFDRVLRTVLEWAMRKRGIPEAMVRAVMSLSARVRIGLEFSEDFEVKVGVHQGSALSPLLFAIMVDVITESVTNGLMLCVDDLF